MRFIKFITTYFISSLLLILCANTAAKAQGCFDEAPELELIAYFKDIKKWQNSNDENSTDSLNTASNKFLNILMSYQQEAFELKDDLNRLIYQGLDFSIAQDKLVSLFSWETSTYPGLHKRYGVLFYKTDNKIQSIQYNEGFAPDRIKELTCNNGRKIYLLTFDNEFTQKGRFKRVMALAIESRFGPVSPTPAFIFKNSPTDSAALVEFNYDLANYNFPIQTPEIIISKSAKKIEVPNVDKNGIWDKKYKTYIFNGNYFIPEKPKLN